MVKTISTCKEKKCSHNSFREEFEQLINKHKLEDTLEDKITLAANLIRYSTCLMFEGHDDWLEAMKDINRCILEGLSCVQQSIYEHEEEKLHE